MERTIFVFHINATLNTGLSSKKYMLMSSSFRVT